MIIMTNPHPTRPEILGIKVFPFIGESATEFQRLTAGYIEVRKDGTAQFNITLDGLAHEAMVKLSDAIEQAMLYQVAQAGDDPNPEPDYDRYINERERQHEATLEAIEDEADLKAYRAEHGDDAPEPLPDVTSWREKYYKIAAFERAEFQSLNADLHAQLAIARATQDQLRDELVAVTAERDTLIGKITPFLPRDWATYEWDDLMLKIVSEWGKQRQALEKIADLKYAHLSSDGALVEALQIAERGLEVIE